MLQATEQKLIHQIAKDTKKLAKVADMKVVRDEYITADEAEKLFGWKKDTLRKMYKAKKIINRKVTFSGRNPRYQKEELVKLFNL